MCVRCGHKTRFKWRSQQVPVYVKKTLLTLQLAGLSCHIHVAHEDQTAGLRSGLRNRVMPSEKMSGMR